MNKKTLSIIIPVYNEAEAIETTIAKCYNVMKKTDIEFEIIAVNDCSTDATAEIIQKQLDSYSNLKVINHPTNSGYGRALKSGISLAAHEIICILDADATYNPEYIPELYREFEKGTDLLIGRRTGVHFKGNFIKNTMRKIYRTIIHFVVGSEVPDANSGLRLFKKSQIVNYFPHLCNGFSFTTSQTLIMFLEGYFVKFVPIEYPKREGKTKVKLFRDSLRTLQFITQIIIRYNPLKLYLALIVLPVILTIVSFVISFFIVSPYDFVLQLFSFVSLLVSVILLVSSILTYAIVSK